MYLSLGGERVLRGSSVIGIFDMDTATVTPITRRFLVRAQRGGRMDDRTGDIPRAFVVTDDEGVYLSQVSPVSLKKRLEGQDGFIAGRFQSRE